MWAECVILASRMVHVTSYRKISGTPRILVISQNPSVVTMALPPFFAPGRPGPPPLQPLPPAPFGCPPPPLPSPAFPPPLPQRPGAFPGASTPFLQPPLALQSRAPGEASRGGGGAFYPVPPPPLPPPPPQCRPFPGTEAGERQRPPPPGPGPPWSLRWPEAPPPSDVLGDAALQRLRDRQWLEAVFGTPRRAGCQVPPRAPAGPSLGEVRARLSGALRLVRRLRDLGQALREAEGDGAAWVLLHAQAAPLRAELAERLQLLTQAAYVGEARRRLERVRRRRLRLRDRAREREAEREAEAARAAEREQEIDLWRVKCVQEVEEKKRVRAAYAHAGRGSAIWNLKRREALRCHFPGIKTSLFFLIHKINRKLTFPTSYSYCLAVNDVHNTSALGALQSPVNTEYRIMQWYCRNDRSVSSYVLSNYNIQAWALCVVLLQVIFRIHNIYNLGLCLKEHTYILIG